MPDILLKRLVVCAVLSLSVVSTGCGAVMSYIEGGPLVRDPSGPTGKIVVDNKSGYTLGAVLLSDCDSSTYGLNRLPSRVGIEDGKTYEFTVSPGCWSIAIGSGTAEVRGKLYVAADQASVYTVN
ncbi:hypothetical protein [Archangium lansingense]|uniref:Lipoprotein n=1 Tax=Archangium lansingense TaxID=2995310 RepID=A0ABT4AB95_9BACT|nr:hypothetical protein [Archangium lansinium]MCY1078946.1 hypothetical protein [Archangium lansinium]